MEFVKWVHHLFNPHCTECSKCGNCDYIRTLLESDRRHYETIIASLTESKAPQGSVTQVATPNPIVRGNSWNHKRRELEMAERARMVQENEQHEESLRVTHLDTRDMKTEDIEAILLTDES